LPIYEYQCTQCGHRVEALQKLSDPPLEVCDACGGAMKRLVSSPAFQFKGSGWYVTDYARKGGKEGSAATGESKVAESKTGDAKESTTTAASGGGAAGTSGSGDGAAAGSGPSAGSAGSGSGSTGSGS
jgi:putative FmdB family regulatory protein